MSHFAEASSMGNTSIKNNGRFIDVTPYPLILIGASFFVEGTLTDHQPHSATTIVKDSQHPRILRDRVQSSKNRTQPERQISPVDRRTQPQAIPWGENSVRRQKIIYDDNEDGDNED